MSLRAHQGARPFTAASRSAPATRRRTLALVRAEAPAAAAASSTSFKDAPLTPVLTKGELTQFPAGPGVYAVFNSSSELQFVGLSRRVREKLL